MEIEEHRKKLEALVTPEIDAFPNERVKELNEALYAMSERGVFELDSVQAELALVIWAAVESVRKHGFPAELRM